MQIDTAGTYTLKYTAEDECGNVTEVTREVEAVQITYRTVLYTDGTFIINEKSTNQAANEALHGAATNVYAPFNPNGSTDRDKYIFSSESFRPWNSQRTSVTSVEIGEEISPPSMAYWFYMFNNCTSMDLSNIDTSDTTSMSNTFAYCSILPSIDVSSFDTGNVTGVKYMFVNCRSLTTLDLSNFDTSKVTLFGSMFNGCSALTSVNVSSFDTSSATDMSFMFNDCSALTTLDTSNFNMSNVTTATQMFTNCSALTSISLANANTSSITNLKQAFYGCSACTQIDLSGILSTALLEDVYYLFYNCRELVTVFASNGFDVTHIAGYDKYASLFYNTLKLVGGAGTTWNSSNASNTAYAKIDGGTADPGYFTLKSA